MPPTIIKPKQVQLKIFRQLHERLKKRFSQHESDNKYYYLRDYKGSENFAGFGLDFWIGHDWVGIDLWGAPLDGSAVKGMYLALRLTVQRRGLAQPQPRSHVTRKESRSTMTVASTRGMGALAHDQNQWPLVPQDCVCR
jgi:hypothetical protein